MSDMSDMRLSVLIAKLQGFQSRLGDLDPEVRVWHEESLPITKVDIRSDGTVLLDTPDSDRVE